MTVGLFVPRPEQIDELTRGIELPLAALHLEHLSLIADVVALAWDDLARNQARTLAAGSEAEINALLEARLSRLLDEHPLWDQLVRSVARGKETVSFDGAHLEKRPDLSIFLSGRAPAFPLVVECKLIDASDGKSGKLYCENGLRRFLTGEYGWSGRDGFMLAYVRDQSTIETCLVPFLAKSRAATPDPFAVRDWPVESGHAALDLATTRHNRYFRYLARAVPADAPGPIAIWHLWLPTPVDGCCSMEKTQLPGGKLPPFRQCVYFQIDGLSDFGQRLYEMPTVRTELAHHIACGCNLRAGRQ